MKFIVTLLMLMIFVGQSSAGNMMSCEMNDEQQNQIMADMKMIDHTQHMSMNSSAESDSMSQMTHLMNTSNEDCCEDCHCYTTSCHQAAVLFEHHIKSNSFEIEQMSRLSILKPNSQFLSYLFKPPIFS
ncbi:MAG: hypothetical protein HRT52_09995 [Colwellia sp.]|nr:hypothetical protein [Colwellia sp.]